jgi:hypothetical protein
MNNVYSSFMAKQCYWLVYHINKKLLQQEWVKKELKWGSYELSKIILYYKFYLLKTKAIDCCYKF